MPTETKRLPRDTVAALARYRRAVESVETTRAELARLLDRDSDALSENAVAELTGFSRMTVRKWRGK